MIFPTLDLSNPENPIYTSQVVSSQVVHWVARVDFIPGVLRLPLGHAFFF
jgi:hypothetical protein